MDRQPHTTAREAVVAEALDDLVRELRLVELADYVAYIRLDRMAALADIVASSAELSFAPGVLRLGTDAEAHVGWDEEARVELDLELHLDGITVFFTLTLEASAASVEIQYVAFERADADQTVNTALLQRALGAARARPSIAATH